MIFPFDVAILRAITYKRSLMPLALLSFSKRAFLASSNLLKAVILVKIATPTIGIVKIDMVSKI